MALVCSAQVLGRQLAVWDLNPAGLSSNIGIELEDLLKSNPVVDGIRTIRNGMHLHFRKSL